MTSNPDEVRARIQAEYDEMEAGAQNIIDNPGLTLDETGEDVAIDWDGDGQPLPNENIRDQARQLLDDIRQDRAEHPE